MRIFYTCLFYLLMPGILLRLWWRGIKAPEYRKRWHERLAFYTQSYPDHVIWFHAVSVGEAEALFPLVKRLQQAYPQERLLITTTTPTGSARVKSVLKDTVSHVYLPYDVPDVLKRFTRCFKPRLAVVMETEIWPNLYALCGQQQIPLFLINARLSERSAKSYRRIAWLIRPALAQIKHIAAQTEEDCQRFAAIGAKNNVSTIGNIKFDVEIAGDLSEQGGKLKANLFPGRFVWLAASTHKGEEARLLPLYLQLKQRIPELLLLIAPRHPERFDEAVQLCSQQGLGCVTRTSGMGCTDGTDVYLLDTLGELKLFYGAADAAFVGGSLVPVGGHNVLEAAAMGVPVIFGPYMANFKAIAASILQHDAAIQCQTDAGLIQAIMDLYAKPDYRAALIANGLAFIQANQGATIRIFNLLEPALSKTNPSPSGL
ncbi:MAG: lipid IV(A) 3-deoxy-D-manno-octulosonic acid transferase [Methylovulum sp.]|uniref:lipid IV(A) 3-deoxy-D-manno-octulosonic acid transferase n=1 Tax=Methylovulum sp. TaxID=1916980 RepID=UPI00262E2DA8|nr:lipid IV(A) 3-deoxy-D-manno-octulosonic acid transferase [Methylovulum sp.]MDD2724919.1 lipid IV(A) 3-deoxy-D-manno-octulosonic acid transferase [Methylovulum sp.]MDD5124289.1 lipid IV(A) 3-deoxy-D-manno-octulosonic acid transferase [Methylovulum sp.]